MNDWYFGQILTTLRFESSEDQENGLAGHTFEIYWQKEPLVGVF